MNLSQAKKLVKKHLPRFINVKESSYYPVMVYKGMALKAVRHALDVAMEDLIQNNKTVNDPEYYEYIRICAYRDKIQYADTFDDFKKLGLTIDTIYKVTDEYYELHYKTINSLLYCELSYNSQIN